MFANENSNSNANRQEERQTLLAALLPAPARSVAVSAEVGMSPHFRVCACMGAQRHFRHTGSEPSRRPTAVFSQQYVVEPSWMCLQFPTKWMGVRKNCERLWKRSVVPVECWVFPSRP